MLDSGLDASVSGSLSQADTDQFSISGCSSFASSQNTSKGHTQKSGDQTQITDGGPGSVSHDDRVLYRDHRIRKTQSVLKQCINKKIAFRERYIDMSRKFLADPTKMDLDEIEVLNLKCQQALAGDISGSDKSDQSDDEADGAKNIQMLISRKRYSKNLSVAPSQPSYHQNWMAGPGQIGVSSHMHITTDYSPMSTQMSSSVTSHPLPTFCQFSQTSAIPLQQNLQYQQMIRQPNQTFMTQSFSSQQIAPNYSQNSSLMPNTYGVQMQASTIPTPPTTTSTPIKPIKVKEVIV